MANVEIRDGDTTEKYLKATGAGTNIDPFVPEHLDSNSAALLSAAQAIQVAAEILDNAIAGNEAQVDVLTVPADPFGANADAAVIAGAVGSMQAKLRLMTSQLDTLITAINLVNVTHAGLIALNGAITGTEVQADLVTLPAANLGQQAMAASLSVVPASNVTDATYVGDIKFGEALPAGTAIIGATKDAGPNWTSSLGVSGARFTSADASTAAAITDVPTSGQKIVLDDIVISTGATALVVDIEEESSGTIFLTFNMDAYQTVQFTPRGKLKAAVADKKFMLDADVAGDVSCTMLYHSES